MADWIMLISVKIRMNKIFLDTNVLIYAKDKSSKYNKWAIDLISQPFRFYTSSKNLSEYFAVVTRGNNPFLTINRKQL
jgi:predicted nucleic acid-binding protein